MESTVGLVGRDDELARLRFMVAGVAEGQGRWVWVDGEPGIGKSTLITAALTEALTLNCQLFSARTDEGAAWFPLRVLLDALRVGPMSMDAGRAEIAELLWEAPSTLRSSPNVRSEALAAGAVTPRDMVAAAAERLLVLIDRLCAAGPAVLALDDVQWADEATLAVVGRLRRVVGQLPLLLIVACRPVPARAEVDRLRREFAADGARLELGALPDPHVWQLVEGLVGAAPGPMLRLQAAHAGGNPLYVRELVDALVREHQIRVEAGMAELVEASLGTPVSLASAIATRLGFLSEQATGVLRLAALLGVDFDVDHLGMLTGRAATELVDVVQEAMAAGVLVPSGTRLMFRHALIRQALYEAMPAGLRSALHRQAAKALAMSGAAAELVAKQLLAPPDTAESWVTAWLADIAPALIDRAPQVAVDLLERVRIASDTDSQSQELICAHLATALFRLGRHEQVHAVAGPVLATTRDSTMAGRLAWTLGYGLLRAEQYEQALSVTGRTLRDWTLSAVWGARVRALHAMILVNSGRYEEAQAAAVRASADGDLAGDRLAVGYALHSLSMIEVRDQRDLAAFIDRIDRALSVIADEPETTDLQLLLLGNRASALYNLGQPAEGDRYLGQALAVAERTGTPPRLAALRVRAAERFFHVGRWDDAMAELDAAAELPLSVGPQLLRRGLGALIAVHRDDRAALDRHLQGPEDLHMTAGEIRYLAEYLLIARALSAERHHEPARALAGLLDVLDPESTLEFPQLTEDVHMWLPTAVRLALSEGHGATAEAAVRASMREAGRQPLPIKVAATLHCRGLLEADPTLLRTAAEDYVAIGYPLFQAHALEDAAVLLGSSGDVRAARAAYGDVLRIYDGLNATWGVLRTETRLRPLGIRRGVRGPRRRPTSGWEALTVTELKIADLVAAGNTNPDIATELFLSRATVNTHVSHILTKLDAHSRVDIAREVISRRSNTHADRRLSATGR